MLTINALTVRYGDDIAVDHIDLTAERGEWLGLVGPNGAGKSTLLRSVAQLQGHLGVTTVDGVELSALGHRERARYVAYVPQQPELPAGMSALSYTLLGRTAHIGYFGSESRADERHSSQLLDRLGVSHLADRTLLTLSGGEMQRVVLARALAQQAPVLLLDEPTSALDIGNRVEALELVDELRHEYGLTVVSVMHDLTLAGQFTDRLALLDHGRLAGIGAPLDVLTEDRLARSFGGHVRVMVDDAGTPIVIPTRSTPSPIRSDHARSPHPVTATTDAATAEERRLAGAAEYRRR